MTTEIKYKVVATGLKDGETPVNRFAVLHNGSIYDDTVYSGVSRKTAMPEPLVKATGGMIWSEIGEWLKKGYRVEFPEMSAFLSLPGSVASSSAESLRETPPDIAVHLVAKGDFKKCCQGPEFVLVNVTKGATVVVDVVIDGISETPNVLTNSTDAEVHVTGRGLYMPDVSDPTVGAYIADSSGKVLVKANVTESTTTTLVCVFPQIDLPEGTYKFCVASRNGLDPIQYGVTVGSRNIQVVNATSAEEVHHG